MQPDTYQYIHHPSADGSGRQTLERAWVICAGAAAGDWAWLRELQMVQMAGAGAGMKNT